MKVLIHDYGCYSFILELARWLASSGQNMTYAYAAEEAPKSVAVQSNNAGALKVISLSAGMPRPEGGWIARRRYERRYGAALAALAKNTTFDAVILANTPLDALAIAQPALVERSVAVINWVQDVRGFAMRRILGKRIPIFGAAIGAYYFELEKRLIAAAQAIVVPSPDFLSEMEAAGYRIPSAFFRPNWMPLESSAALSKDNNWARRFELEHTSNVCYFGTFGHKQDLSAFITIARHLVSRPNAKLVVSSVGPAVGEFRAMVDRFNLANVIFIPWQDYACYPQMLATADVLLSVTTDDAASFSVPSKILGYLCAERPILAIVPRRNYAARILESEEMGLVVEPGDHVHLVEAIDRLLEDARFSHGLVRNARAYAGANFKIEQNGRFFSDLIASVVRDSNNRPKHRRPARHPAPTPWNVGPASLVSGSSSAGAFDSAAARLAPASASQNSERAMARD